MTKYLAGRPVEWNYGTETRKGWFLAFGNQWEELRNDKVGQSTTVIVEDAEGVISEFPPSHIRFTDRDKPAKTSTPREADTAYSQDFEALWKIYPRNDGKSAAYRCYKKKLKNGVKAHDLLSAARNYKKHSDLDETPLDRVKFASTFFGRDNWWESYVNWVPAVPTERKKKANHTDL